MNGHMTGDTSLCPVTGQQRTDEFRECWTLHDRPGAFNACPQCDPDGETGSERLQRLNKERAR
jgi:hypothetical protein